jgi:hypothetical protein
MSGVTRYDKLDLDEILYDKPENTGSVYFGPISYKSSPLFLQSSRLLVKEIKKDEKYTYLVVATAKDDFSFYDTLVKLDDNNLEQTYQQSEKWFNKELPMDILEGMYKRITEPFKKDDIPSIEFRLPYLQEELQTKIYDQSNELIGLDRLIPGSTIILMNHVRGLKFLKQNYYCDLHLSQIKLIQQPISEPISDPITASCLIEDDGSTEVKVQHEDKYDYEILDEEIIQKNKGIEELETTILEHKQTISEYTEKIDNENEIISKLEEKLVNLK